MDSLSDLHIGHEARAADHSATRLWLRLLSCSVQIEQHIRTRLRQSFGTTLPRFDYLAQLARHPEGLKMNVLSRYLMVTSGNVTGLTDQLMAEGWVERLPDPNDRRALVVRLTERGHLSFGEMALEHQKWLENLLEGFDESQRQLLYEALGQLRLNLVRTGGSSN